MAESALHRHRCGAVKVRYTCLSVVCFSLFVIYRVDSNCINFMCLLCMLHYRWRFSSLVTFGLNQLTYSTGQAGLVLRWVTLASSFRVRAILVFNQPPRSTQPGHPTVGMVQWVQAKVRGVCRHAAWYGSAVFVASIARFEGHCLFLADCHCGE